MICNHPSVAGATWGTGLMETLLMCKHDSTCSYHNAPVLPVPCFIQSTFSQPKIYSDSVLCLCRGYFLFLVA